MRIVCESALTGVRVVLDTTNLDHTEAVDAEGETYHLLGEYLPQRELWESGCGWVVFRSR